MNQRKKVFYIVSTILALTVLISAFVFVIAADSHSYKEEDAIIFDLSKGNILFTDEGYTGWVISEKGTEVNQAKTGTHDENNIYVIKQTVSSATNHVISVGTPQTAVTKKFEIHLRSLNIDAPKAVGQHNVTVATDNTVSIGAHAPAVYVNTNEDTVYLILDNGSSSTMQAYAHIFDSTTIKEHSSYKFTGALDKNPDNFFGHAAIEKEIESNNSTTSCAQGSLVITCEQGYANYQNNNTSGHDCTKDGECGSLNATAFSDSGMKGGSATRTAAAAAIGSKAEVTQDGKGKPLDTTQNNPPLGTLHNLIIAGGRITAKGGVGNYNKDTSNRNIYLGGSPGIGVGAGMQQYSRGYNLQNLRITGGYIDAIAGDGSSANIGGGYHAGDVEVNIYGGTILAYKQATYSTSFNNNYFENPTNPNDMKRGAGIGGGGGGSDSSASNGATVNIYGGTVYALSSYGAAIGAGGGGKSGSAEAATVNITGGTIHAKTTAGKDNNGAGAAIGTGGSLGTGKGGATTINISGGTIIASSQNGADIGGGGTNSSESTSSGGNATITISGGTITAMTNGIGGGKAKAGKGGNATLTITGGEISAAAVSGGSSNTSNGGFATVTVSDGTIKTGSIGGGSGKTIGAAFVTIDGGTLQGQIIMEGSTKINNVTQSSSFNMTGGTIDNANASGSDYTFKETNGGAVCVKSGTATISGGKIINCGSDTMLGGAIYLTGGNVIMSDGEISGCRASNGGAIYVAGGDVTVSGGTIKNCSAAAGGAIYVTEIAESSAKGSVTVSGGTIELCAATQGGAIYMTAGTFNMPAQKNENTSNDAIIQNCTAQQGGAIYMGGGELTVAGGTITSNKAILNTETPALASGDTATAANGGAAYLANGTLKIAGGTISKNTAENGGAAYLGGGTLTMSGGTVTENTASNDGGGAYLGGGTFNMSGGTISKNNAINGGGALVANGMVEISGGSVEYNTAQTNGGGIAITDGNFTMHGGAIDNNTATNGDGGGLYVSASEQSAAIIVRSGAITNNKAGANGGAIGVYGATNTVEFTITIGSQTEHKTENGEITHNISANDTIQEACPKIENNTSQSSGGGIYLAGNYNATMNMHCLTESGNQVGTGNTPSDFMMVDGGKLNIQTSANDTQGLGHIEISSNIQVTGGQVTLSGAGDNPKFTGNVTIDVDEAKNEKFEDSRTKVEGSYSVQYFENFTDTSGQTSGQYVFSDVIVVQGAKHTVKAASTYSVIGYKITGWRQYTKDKDNKFVDTGNVYAAGAEVDFNQDLYFFAEWKPVGYQIQFEPGVDSYSGTMQNQYFDYTATNQTLIPNAYINKGYLFVQWVWKNGDDTKTFSNGEEISEPLSSVDGTIIKLTAVWRICDHQHENSENISSNSLETQYIISKTENSISRTCPCHGYSETATLTGKTVTYDGNPHKAELTHTYESVNQYEGLKWNITIFYEGTLAGIGDDESTKTTYESNNTAPTDAGQYTASFQVNIPNGTYSPSTTIYINKANQKDPPIPKYNTEKDDTLNKMNIVISLFDQESFISGLEYRISYYDETSQRWQNSEWKKWTEQQAPPSFALEKIYTNYYVSVRYAETNNYNASIEVRGESVIVWTGQVTFHFTSDAGLIQDEISGKPNESQPALQSESTTENGITIKFIPSTGYYIHNIQWTALNHSDYVKTLLIDNKGNCSNSEWTIWIHQINDSTSSIDVNIHFTGAEKIPTVEASTAKDQIFGELKNEENVTISNDSAYTVQFDIKDYKHYTSPAIQFSQALPVGTTLIMIDRSDSTYWGYTVNDGNVNSVSLSKFAKMSNGEEYSVKNIQNENGQSVEFAIDLNLRFIVDFSRCETKNFTSNELRAHFTATSEQITVKIYKEDGTFEEKIQTVPPLSEVLSTVKLQSTSFTISNSNPSSGLTNVLDYEFANDAIGISKWNDRNLVLVFEYKDQNIALPADARLKVSVGDSHNIYYLTDEKKYIALLPSVGEGEIRVELLSDMLPNADQTFVFDVSLYASNTKHGSADVELMKLSDNIKFTITATPTFDLHVKLEGNLPQVTPKPSGSTEQQEMPEITFKLEGLTQQDFTNYVVLISLYEKQESVYVDSTFKEELTGLQDSYSFKLPPKDIYTITPHISYMLHVEIVDRHNNNAIVYSVPLYFILINADYNPNSATS